MSETERTDLAIAYDHETRTLTIVTPGGCRIVVGDGDGALAIADGRGNSARFSATGISLESAGDVSIRAGGCLSLTADARLTLASGNVAELSATAQTTITGAIVTIN